MSMKVIRWGTVGNQRQLSPCSLFDGSADVNCRSDDETPKLLSGIFLSASVRFWCKADALIKKHGLNTNEVACVARVNARIPIYVTSKFSQPDRRCPPTSMKRLISGFRREGSNQLVPQVVRTYNLRIEERNAST